MKQQHGKQPKKKFTNSPSIPIDKAIDVLIDTLNDDLDDLNMRTKLYTNILYTQIFFMKTKLDY